MIKQVMPGNENPSDPRPASAMNLRLDARRNADCVFELAWKSGPGEKKFESCRALDLSESGVAVECPEAIPVAQHLCIGFVFSGPHHDRRK